MHFPVEIHLLGWSIHAHQILEIAAYAAGFQLYLLLRRRWPRGPALDAEQTAWIVIGVIFGALLGSKGLAWAESFSWYWAHRTDWHVFVGGKTIVGAILGGWVGVEIAKRFLRISHPSGDIYVFPTILGMCIGRVGCFLEGLDDHTCGLPTSLPWGVNFGDGIPRHPTQLYEIAFLLALAAFFAWRRYSGRQRGCMFSQFVLAYLAFRFAAEFIKPRDTLPGIGLSAIQVACLGGIVYACFHWNDQCCGVSEPGPAGADDPATLRSAAGTCNSATCGCPAPAAPTTVELTNSLCPACLRKVEAKIIIDAGQVFLQKFCPTHGPQRVLIADDAPYWQHSRSLYAKPPTAPRQVATTMRRGCPWDCGLCPDHEQHTCLAIVEITAQCDLACPVCYAGSTPAKPHRTLQQVEAMLDAVVAAEGQPGVVQISGGEPTLHPDLFAILDAARARPIRHLMLNTNGRRIAEDPDFAARLAAYKPAFELYLQFDSLRPVTLRQLRGADLSTLRQNAIRVLNAHNISTTLVVTLKKGVNDRDIGEILNFAMAQPCVRGVTFQPIQAAGRLGGFDPALHRLTLTEVRRAILEQCPVFSPADLVPVPCHPDALMMGYALRNGHKMVALSKLVDPQSLLNMGGNTICFEQEPALRQHVRQLLRADSPTAAARRLGLQCCLPLLPANGSPIAYDKIFRVIVMQFMDAYSMDLRSVKRSCVHIVGPDGRLIPFETCNIFYRNGDPEDLFGAATGTERPIEPIVSECLP